MDVAHLVPGQYYQFLYGLGLALDIGYQFESDGLDEAEAEGVDG